MPKRTATRKGWQKRRNIEDLRLPSGEVAQVRRIGPQLFFQAGIVPDSLAPIVQGLIESAQGGKPQSEEDIVKAVMSTGDMEAMFRLVDNVLVASVVSPKVAIRPEDPDDEQDDIFYTDEVDEDDKNFIFQYVVGGTRDWERFRRETSGTVGSVPPGEVAADQAV